MHIHTHYISRMNILKKDIPRIYIISKHISKSFVKHFLLAFIKRDSCILLTLVAVPPHCTT